MTTDVYNQVFEYNPGSTGETNNANSVETTVTLREYPDLRVTQIDNPESDLRPAQQIDISWTILNEGNSDTERDWVDYVYLSDDAAVGSNVFLGQFIATGLVIPAGESRERTGQVTLPSFGAFSGEGRMVSRRCCETRACPGFGAPAVLPPRHLICGLLRTGEPGLPGVFVSILVRRRQIRRVHQIRPLPQCRVR